jgi:uncharacterized protein YdaU (DUF1376 family)
MSPDKLLAEWFWTDRWMGSSAFLLPQEARGVYREMLTQAWRRGAELPNDHEAIKRATGTTSKEWARSWPLIERFWRVDGNRLVNDTQLEVYADAMSRSNRASARGQKGGKARAQALLKQNSSSAQVDTQGVLERKPPISDLRKEHKSAREPDDSLLDRAREFIERYPRMYAEERGGAHYQVREARDFPTVLEIVTGWTDDARLDDMFRVFLHLDGRDVLNKPGSPGQFLHHAPECDVLLRKNGR